MRVYVLTAQGEALPVELPRSYSRKIDRIRFVPGQGATADFAQELLNTEWVWTDKHPHSTHALADDTVSRSSIQIKPKPKSADLFDAQPINMQGIRVEIFTFSYARDLQQLSTHLIDSVELRK